MLGLRERGHGLGRLSILVLMAMPVVVFLVSISIGRYPVSIDSLVDAALAQITGADMDTAQLALSRVRLPRILLAMIVGASLTRPARSLQRGLLRRGAVHTAGGWRGRHPVYCLFLGGPGSGPGGADEPDCLPAQ